MKQTTSRNPWMAALMSLVLPGFGQLYNGHVNKGLLLFIGICLINVPLVLWLVLDLPTSLTLPLVILTLLASIVLWLYGIINAYRSAKKLNNYTLQSWQMPAVYLATFLVAIFIILPLTTNYLRKNQVESFHIPSRSMEPSVMKGDVLFANKSYNCHGCWDSVKRGDIAVFVYPNNRTLYYIKRIVGLPGDVVRMEGQQVYINGESLQQKTENQDDYRLITEKAGDMEYQVKWSTGNQFETTELTVPQGEVLVLGDNRSASNDSRIFGTVPIRDVVGQASQVWFSKGDKGIRWERLGLVLK